MGLREGTPSSNRNFDFQEPPKISIFWVQRANQNGSLPKEKKVELWRKTLFAWNTLVFRMWDTIQ
jgi:hypothetical protein